MTISTETRRAGPYAGNGATQVFAFSFKTFSSADLVVVTTTSGVDTVKTITTHYTVSLNADQNNSPGGSITMLAAPASGTSVTILSARAFLQSLNVQNAGAMLPANLNAALDNIVIGLQQVVDELQRMPRGALSDDVMARLPTAALRADGMLGFDSSGDPTILSSTAFDNLVALAADIEALADIAASIVIVADADVDIGVVAADLSGDNTIGAVADALTSGVASSLEVTDSGESDQRTLSDWMSRVDRLDPTTLQVQRLNFTIATDPTGTEARRVGAYYVAIDSEADASTAGTWLNYAKSGRLTSGNDLGRVLVARWDNIGAGAAWADWIVASGPLDPASGLPGAPVDSQAFGVVLGEANAQQRYGDGGYFTERRLASRWVGGWQWTPETQDFTGTLGGERRGYNVLFQHAYTHSPYTATDTELQAKTYHLHLVEPNAVAPGGDVIFAAGHRPFVASVAIDSGGSGYVAGDVGKIVTVSGGGGSDLSSTVEIVEVTAGAVTEVRVYTGGRYDTPPSSPAATSGGGTTGAGLTLTVTMSTASSDPNAIIDADDFWETGFDFRKATFRDAVLGNNQAMRFVQAQGLAWAATAGGTPYNAFGVSSANATYVAPIDNAVGIQFNTRLNSKIVLAIDTSVGASVTDYVAVKGTAGAGGEIQALSSASDADLILRPKGAGSVDLKLAAGGGLEINTVAVLKATSESDWTPTVGATSGTLTTVTTPTARYTRIGPMIYFTIVITVTNNGTGSGSLTFTLPSTPAYAGTAAGRNATSAVAVSASWSTTSTVNVNLATGLYPVTSGQTLRISGSYLVA